MKTYEIPICNVKEQQKIIPENYFNYLTRPFGCYECEGTNVDCTFYDADGERGSIVRMLFNTFTEIGIQD